MIPLKVTIEGKTKLFHGFGINKKQAKCAAAKQALKSLLYKRQIKIVKNAKRNNIYIYKLLHI